MYLLNRILLINKNNSLASSSVLFYKINKLSITNDSTIKNFLVKKIIKQFEIKQFNKISTSAIFLQQQKNKSRDILNQLNRNYERKSKTSYLNSLWYILSGFVIMIGASYAAVPLFKLFCESQGIEVNTEFRDMSFDKLADKLSGIKKVENRNIEVKFVASTSSSLLWKFEPSQETIKVAPGETALAFFKAKNLTDRSIIGIATYTILPYEAGLYFNKIQCFCFEEQRLDPNEEVDMPVFFYIDEDFINDPKLEDVDEICLSYTFFESKGSEDLEKLQKLAARPNI